MSTVNDEKYRAVNVTGLSLDDEYIEWLKLQGAVGNTLPDLESSLLALKGFTGKPTTDLWFAYLGSLGHTGALSDRYLQFWTAAP